MPASDEIMENKTKPQAQACTTTQFREIDPWNHEDSDLKRRNLPHLKASGATYFVTFRAKIRLPPETRDIVMAEIRDREGNSIELDAAVVMPDHVHMILRLIGDEDLSDVLRMIKGRAARLVNQFLIRKGPLWIEESFDHVIRYEEEFQDKLEYVRQNPVKRGLVAQPGDYKWLFVRAADVRP